MDIVQDFSTRLIKGLGSGRVILNPFKFDTNTNLTRAYLTCYPVLTKIDP